VSKKAQKELERERMTQELTMKERELDQLKIWTDTTRGLRGRFETCASAQAGVLHGITANKK
jgi:hypothetical protein